VSAAFYVRRRESFSLSDIAIATQSGEDYEESLAYWLFRAVVAVPMPAILWAVGE
jgi:hypothetical protein